MLIPVGQGDCTVIQCPKANTHDTNGMCYRKIKFVVSRIHAVE